VTVLKTSAARLFQLRRRNLKSDDAPVTRPEFEKALDAFGWTVSAMRLIAFWGKKRKDGQRPWTEKPEREAQKLPFPKFLIVRQTPLGTPILRAARSS
jgi:hypothetical protein